MKKLEPIKLKTTKRLQKDYTHFYFLPLCAIIKWF